MHVRLLPLVLPAAAVALSATLYHATTHTWCIPQPVTGDKQSNLFSAFQHGAWSGDSHLIEKTFNKYIVEDYIQHNPFLPQGAAPVVELLKGLTKSTSLEAVRMGFDGGLGWVHSRGSPKPGHEDEGKVTAIVDIYRMNGSCIVEHWDVMQEVAGNATNELGMF
ncbi:hypothetical protein M409DRAFT_29296 [Zasmidium cellare ATCC 36951]|uniref:SnoaL-like domain-containing protein n=1 Tax=Zasmidium cellare ATCC 36951 TaxID=1080233 RepID=A0A6A6BZL0_ZASCE|nr:uncharacterized protein M409DRAFT_29296 [Zasmidium cellare ATCC 36951]KAF2160211.1 hypothetical protein M409DRAFT_29296 [Zasmidium cellare ATCC 36951]